MLAVALFLYLFVSSGFSQQYSNNVCRNLADYFIIDFSPNCWYDPDVGASPQQIINNYGYPFESHEVVTEDGYRLTMFRIPKPGGSPIFLQHGILTNSLAFLGLKNNSLPFRLHDNGYDVWLGNSRGTIYSNSNTKNLTNKEYWNFSFHEMGYYDLPAVLDYIVSYTKNRKKVTYIGHSMGTTMSYIYPSLRPIEAEKRLAGLISLAPVAYMRHLGTGVSVLSQLDDRLKILKTLANVLKIYHTGAASNEEQDLNFLSCLYGFTAPFCDLVNSFMLQLTSNSLAPSALPFFLTQTPSGVSIKTVEHYAQEVRDDGHFQQFDYGNQGNLQKYGTKEPPAYDVGNISVPVYLFYGKADTIADEKDVETLYEAIDTKKFLTAIPVDGGSPAYDHFNFVFSKNIEELYVPLFKVIEDIEKAQV